MTWLATLALTVLLQADLETERYRAIIETKYGAPLERFEVVSLSPTTKVLWFDWQEAWWGGMNVIEVSEDGTPLYWYDIPDPPGAQSIESIRVVNVAGEDFLEVIDCTHMGNGYWHMYALRTGRLRLLAKTQVILHGAGRFFWPRIAEIEYRDLDGDGDEDVVIDAECINSQFPKDSPDYSSKIHHEFLFEDGDFQEVAE